MIAVNFVTCLPVAGNSRFADYPGATKSACSMCSCKVWVAPGTRERLDFGDRDILCSDCTKIVLATCHVGIVVLPPPEAVRPIARYLAERN